MIVVLSGAWAVLRLPSFDDRFIPLTYVVPLLACAWTRRRWQLWAMVFFFAAVSVASFLAASPAGGQDLLDLVTSFLNLALGGAIIHAIINYRDRIERSNAVIAAQNARLEAEAEERMQQNEEIKAQAEELAQQNEEIESQTEELTRQNEELHAANARLAVREHLLQDLLHSSRSPLPDGSVLESACRRSLEILGSPAQGAAILLLSPEVGLRAAASVTTAPIQLPAEWPVEGSLAGMVIRESKTAYLSDISLHPELAPPFSADSQVRSLLVTTLHCDGSAAGVLAIASTEPHHWSEEQFTLIEWIAAKCGQIVEATRWREALTSRTRELEAAARAKDEFLAMLSHELRTPLTPVLAAAGVLAKDARLPADVADDLLMIRRNVSIQSRLIDDLLDLTRIERGKLDLNRQEIRVLDLLQESAAIVGPDLDAREQKIILRCRVPESCRILGDGARLQQVLWNLLQNATKFSPPRSHIFLSAEPGSDDPQRVVIRVEDEGTGIANVDLERIFKPFEQVRNSKRIRRDSGLGLGLAIARAIAELHDGTLTVRSRGANTGSCFLLELPLSTVDGSRSPIPEAPEPGKAEPLSILLVEDHSDTGRIIARLLRSAGHEVLHASTVADALDQFRRGRFDLVISDIGLPDESGLVLMQRLRETQPAIAGICMSGYGMESDIRAFKEAGFIEYLAKPVDVQRLHAAIHRISRRRENTPRN